eukprot:CAMPEP_0172310780 /NCGR_PEP_ID=MMETSP1058-20130122/12684_1 /TAXON_ID=83371 /ORGANISM="Detonula confervacea, Strain CCMP 353" /LENGTH=292 /DNA_ID=CAMNT_0013023719 /DNA_START=196 /DNA_END=1075 /DNA_ORIENTATION=+
MRPLFGYAEINIRFPIAYVNLPTASINHNLSLVDEDPVAENSGNEKESLLDTTFTSEIGSKAAISDSGFGESVPYVPLSQRNQPVSNNDSPDFFALDGDSSEVELLKQNRVRNIAVAIASFAVAIFNYGWHFTHPVTAVEILASMQKQSAPLTAIGNNGKPTVIDFWAPWCSSCKVAAPTLQSVEQEYGDKVNFIMVNADDGRNYPFIQLFGVDAIPHLALLSGEGDVETALIGPTSRNVIRADIDALLNKHEDCEDEVVPVCHEEHDELPYTMFDAFGNRPESRRINFVER